MSDKPTLFTLDASSVSTVQREEVLNNRPLTRHLFNVAKYLGIGALVHAWFLGPDFDTGSLWSWGYIAAWPVPLAFWFVAQVAVFGLYAMLLIVSVALLWLCFVLTAEMIERRRRRAERAARIYDPRD
ncbi:hypothetical protein [Methylorubrum suomiense]|uniref:Uncharacterized protein n=1 Tax=Methylorubrum suomiense TaxID=144191 RepID=A0ABQ4V230_9HYPH|nr:hypothetical protein [Methylorubrum suomiense]GJE78134.1 hypothetical protein BGCPKDLD_4745 [Methylorubrum suomiense]